MVLCYKGGELNLCHTPVKGCSCRQGHILKIYSTEKPKRSKRHFEENFMEYFERTKQTKTPEQ